MFQLIYVILFNGEVCLLSLLTSVPFALNFDLLRGFLCCCLFVLWWHWISSTTHSTTWLLILSGLIFPHFWFMLFWFPSHDQLPKGEKIICEIKTSWLLVSNILVHGKAEHHGRVGCVIGTAHLVAANKPGDREDGAKVPKPLPSVPIILLLDAICKQF